MTDKNNSDTGHVEGSRTALLRRSLLLQVKLIVDGIRDFLLVPVALVATLVGLVRGGSEPDREFNQVIDLGRATEEWIDLFGTHHESRQDEHSEESINPKNLEEWAGRVEASIQKEIKSGELSEQAARKLRSALGRAGVGRQESEKKDPAAGQ